MHNSDKEIKLYSKYCGPQQSAAANLRPLNHIS